MLMGLLVLLLAWALADVSKDLQTADYIVSSLGGSIPMNLLPAIIFVMAAITAFGSGSSWGVMAILMPLVIPLTWAVMENHGGANPENYHIMYSSVACVLTGAVFGVFGVWCFGRFWRFGYFGRFGRFGRFGHFELWAFCVFLSF